MSLSGKNALVTGSSRGIGRGIALELAERGAHVGITYHQNEPSAKACDSQGKAFLLGVQRASKLMGRGGRILAITYSDGSRTGSWLPWVAMGSAKAAMESLVRYFAVALARRGITVNAISPGFTDG